MNAWKLSTIVLASVLLGFVAAQFAGFGLVRAQAGGEAKVQLDTSNCSTGINYQYAMPKGSFLVQVVPDGQGQQLYVYDVCR